MSNVNPNPPAAILAFNQAVARKVKAGLKRAAAVKAVVAEDPGLHQEYLKAVNQGPGAGARSAGKGLRPLAGSEAIAQWDRAIEAKVSAGKSKAKAARELVEENPDLHTAYLAAVNSARKPRGAYRH